MRFYIITIVLLIQSVAFSQKKCEYDVNINDSLGNYKETKTNLVYEKMFGNSKELVFFTLAVDNGTPILKLQIIQKDKDFINPKCIDEKSRIYLQLNSGKIYTLIANENKCDNLIYNSVDKENNRILDANFLFVKNDFEDLKNSPIMLMKIRFANEEKEYFLQKELVSEKVESKTKPSSFFIDYFHCIEQ